MKILGMLPSAKNTRMLSGSNGNIIPKIVHNTILSSLIPNNKNPAADIKYVINANTMNAL